MRTISCAQLIAAADLPVMRDRAIGIDNGQIASVESVATSTVHALLALPALVNAHDHGRAVRTSSIGAGGKPLESWLVHLALFPSVDPYLAALVAFGRNVLGGVGTVLTHYTRAQGFTDLPTEAAEVARAARDIGLRVGFAISMRDRNPLVYGPSEPVLAMLPPEARGVIERKFLSAPLLPKEYIALVEAVAAAAAGPMFEVQFGPNGVHWCSQALLEAIAEASARSGRRIHMHLLETRYQRAWADANHPEGVVKFLDKIGLLSPRLALAHCVWARPDELELLAERGVTLATNSSSNLHLRSGVAPVARMMASGCRVAMGIDSQAFDDDGDGLRELRVGELLHAGTGFTPATTRQQMLAMAFANGRFSVTNSEDGGTISPGAPADILLLDWAEIDDDRLRDDINVLDLLITRATARHIRELIVAGRSVVKDGAVSGADYPGARAEVIAKMRAGMSQNAALAAALPALEHALAIHYEPDSGCC